MENEIIIREVKSRGDLKKFIHLPAKIHKTHSNWVPPIYMDDWTFFNPKKNKLFDHCDVILILASKNGTTVGRGVGIIHHEYNEKHNENHGRFSFIETWNEPEVYHQIIEYIAIWAKQKGMTKLIGPLAFSDKDPQGYLYEGFNEPNVIASNCNFPYMIALTENEGFTKKVDLVVYKIEIPDEIPSIYNRINARFNEQHPNLKVLEFKSHRKLKPHIKPVLNLVNRTFTNIYGFTPFTENEMDDFANRYLLLINPRFVKLIQSEDNEPVAMLIGMSDISKGIQKSKGYIFPFGIFRILRSGKKSKQLNLLLGAIDPHFQGKGLDVIMGIKLIESARKAGKKVIDSHLELEHNTKVRAEMERMGGIVYKRFRIFEKEL